ncbi:hypothetical protein SESBI_45105 [Sesbania bispinosa]|nr:hypothetical protein SESBI_45105 [Sesbania bispinosa]
MNWFRSSQSSTTYSLTAAVVDQTRTTKRSSSNAVLGWTRVSLRSRKMVYRWKREGGRSGGRSILLSKIIVQQMKSCYCSEAGRRTTLQPPKIKAP